MLNDTAWKITIGALAGLAVVATLLLGFRALSGDASYALSQVSYSIVPAGAGIVLMAAGRRHAGRERLAWMAIGAGVLAWGVGEIIWVVYEVGFEAEVPYPGWADVAYVSGYPLLFFGVLLLPHVKPRRLERVRLSLDALAGSIAFGAVMWVAYLGEQIYIDPEVGFLEQTVNLLYPIGDVWLLVALMILSLRRSSRRFDVRLIALATGMVLTGIADVLYYDQVDTYASGGPLDSVWLAAYGAFAVAAWYVMRPAPEIEHLDGTTRLWQMITPYAAVVALFGMTLFEPDAPRSVLQLASLVVSFVIIGRQAVSIRENRELVNKQRDDLIASISHELRTPITSVQGFAQILQENGEALGPERRIEVARTIEQQARHLGGIVTDLVDVARGHLSATHLSVESLTVDAVIASAVAMLPASERNGSTIEVDCEADLTIGADERRITQVLVNLLTNACRYGSGEIGIWAYRASGSAHIEVHDDGPGVPRRYQDTIWDRFDRGPHRLDATIPGSGIGLSVARALSEAHGGTIDYTTSPRLGGACFTVRLPLGRTAAENLAVAERVPA